MATGEAELDARQARRARTALVYCIFAEAFAGLEGGGKTCGGGGGIGVWCFGNWRSEVGLFEDLIGNVEADDSEDLVLGEQRGFIDAD